MPKHPKHFLRNAKGSDITQMSMILGSRGARWFIIGGGGLSIAKRQAKLMLTSLFCFTMYRLVIGRFFIRFFIQRMCNMNMNSEFTIYPLICHKYTIVWPNLLTPYWVVISGLWPYVIEIVSLEYIMLFFRSFKNYLRIYKVAFISRRYTFALLKQTVVWQLIFFFFKL